MKKNFKILILVTGSAIIISIIGLLLTYWWISTEWKNYYSVREMQDITTKIKNSEKLPENFYLAYDKIYPEQRIRTLRQMSFHAVWLFITNKRSMGYFSFDLYIFAHGLEEYTNESKCFDYFYNKSNINDYSFKCFSKPLTELSIKENIELLIRLEKPTFYKEHPDLLVKKMLDYE